MRALPLTIHNMKWMEFLLELSCIIQNTGYKNKQQPYLIFIFESLNHFWSSLLSLAFSPVLLQL
jgi:hypothetical protein